MKNYLILLIFISCLNACNKPNKYYPTVFLDAKLKQTFDNKVGSYWIFKDSLTGDMDSFVLSFVDKGYKNKDGRSNNEYLRMEIRQLGFYKADSCKIEYYFEAQSLHQFHFTINNALYNNSSFWFNNAFDEAYTDPRASNKDDTIITTNFSSAFILGSHSFDAVSSFIRAPKINLDSFCVSIFDANTGLVKIRLPYQDGNGKSIKILELQRWNLIK